jgi:hypothetical protein
MNALLELVSHKGEAQPWFAFFSPFIGATRQSKPVFDGHFIVEESEHQWPLLLSQRQEKTTVFHCSFKQAPMGIAIELPQENNPGCFVETTCMREIERSATCMREMERHADTQAVLQTYVR